MSHHEEELNDYIREEAEEAEEGGWSMEQIAFMHKKIIKHIKKQKLKKDDLISLLAAKEIEVKGEEERIKELEKIIDCGSPQECFNIRKEQKKRIEKLEKEIKKLKDEAGEIEFENDSLKYHIGTLKEEIKGDSCVLCGLTIDNVCNDCKNPDE